MIQIDHTSSDLPKPGPNSFATPAPREHSGPYIGLLAAGILLRLAIISGLFLTWINDSDLRNYYWAAKQMAGGGNAYLAWAANLQGPRSDLLPFELGLLTLVVRFGGTALAIRSFFVLADMVVLALLFAYFADKAGQRRLWFALYSVGPATLYYFTITPSDKPILLGLFLAALLALRVPVGWRGALGSVVTGLLAAFKWFGLWMAIPVAVVAGRKRWRWVCVHAGIIGGIFALSHFAWMPDWAIVYLFRQERFTPPFHAGLAVLLQWLGLPMVKLYAPLMIGSWLLVTVLYLRGLLDWERAAVLSILAFLIWAPDGTPQMTFLLTLLVLLVIRWDTPGRAWLVWLGTSWSALMMASSIGDPLLGGLGLQRLLHTLSGAYGSIPLVVWTQGMLFVSIYWLIRDQYQSFHLRPANQTVEAKRKK